MRPPGPFPSHSAAHLEQELKKYLDLDSEWTSWSPEPVSERVIDLGYPMRVEDVTIVLGRYVLVTTVKAMRCYDLDLPGGEGEDGKTQLIASYDLSWYHRPHYICTILGTDVDERENVYESPWLIVCVVERFPTEDDMQSVV
jgi:hypothetical protein